MSIPFPDQVLAVLPKLRIQARALTRNRPAAEDLVQEAVCNALRAQASFVPGTNFPAWMHRILRNRFVSDRRKRRDATDIADVPEAAFATSAAHEDGLALKELGQAMARLPADQREALLMVVVHGMGYEAVAEAAGCAVGTAKSRVFRARRQLEAWLLGEAGPESPVRQKPQRSGTRGLKVSAPAETQQEGCPLRLSAEPCAAHCKVACAAVLTEPSCQRREGIAIARTLEQRP